ncbi:MAG: RDD family protein, partial [Acidimicrobiia bacterium]
VPIRVRLLAWMAVLGHLVLLEGTGGQTFGKRLAGIRVVDEATGGPIGYSVAAHRVGARAAFWFVSFLALADPLLQTLHDRSAGTVVVKVPQPAGRPPSPERIEFETTEDA